MLITDLSTQPVRSITKQQQTHRERVKLTQRQKGDISTSVRKRVNARTIFAPVGHCERCLKNRHGFMALEQAHIDSRVRIGHKTTEYDLIRLCGPSSESGTCHHWVESTREGKAWMREFQKKLMQSV